MTTLIIYFVLLRPLIISALASYYNKTPLTVNSMFEVWVDHITYISIKMTYLFIQGINQIKLVIA